MRGSSLALALLLWAGPAHSADWARAGGGLFVGEAPVISDPPAPAAPPAAGERLRLEAPVQPYGEAVAAAADRFGLDPKLLHAVVTVESAYRADAVSPAGAAGLTQLMPATAARLGVRDRFDPAQNLLAGAAYLALQIRRFGDLRLALAAYNAGPGRVAALGHAPEIAETQAYVGRVVDCYLALAAGRGVRSAADCRPQGDRHER